MSLPTARRRLRRLAKALSFHHTPLQQSSPQKHNPLKSPETLKTHRVQDSSAFQQKHQHHSQTALHHFSKYIITSSSLKFSRLSNIKKFSNHFLNSKTSPSLSLEDIEKKSQFQSFTMVSSCNLSLPISPDYDALLKFHQSLSLALYPHSLHHRNRTPPKVLGNIKNPSRPRFCCSPAAKTLAKKRKRKKKQE